MKKYIITAARCDGYKTIMLKRPIEAYKLEDARAFLSSMYFDNKKCYLNFETRED